MIVGGEYSGATHHTAKHNLTQHAILAHKAVNQNLAACSLTDYHGGGSGWFFTTRVVPVALARHHDLAIVRRDDLGVSYTRSPQLRVKDGYLGEDIWGLWVLH